MGTNNSAKISEQGRIYSLDENDIIPVSSGGTRASITGDALKTIIKEEAKTVCVSTETTNQFLPATKIISVRFAFDSNIPYTNIANGVIRILKEELVGYVFVDGDKLHFRKQTVVTVNGVYLVKSQDETSITLTKLYNNEILNEVFVEENSLIGVWFSSYNGTSLDFDFIRPLNANKGDTIYLPDGESFSVKDKASKKGESTQIGSSFIAKLFDFITIRKYTNWTDNQSSEVIEEIQDSDGNPISRLSKFGQWKFWGKNSSTSIALHNKVRAIYALFYTVDDNGCLDLNSSDGTQKVHLDSNGVNIFSNEIQAPQATDDTHLVTLGQMNTADGSKVDKVTGKELWSENQVLSTILTGLSFISGTAVTSTDSILVAIGKLQKQFTNHKPWTKSGHTGTANKIAGFGSSGEAVEIDYPTTVADEALELAEVAMAMSNPSSGGLTESQVTELINNSLSANAVLSANRPYNGKKLVTLGDSMTYNNLYQPFIALWNGFVYSSDETKNGVDGHAKMGWSGSKIIPSVTDDPIAHPGSASGASIYKRADDVHFYSPDVIILWGSQNDNIVSGNISDAPYTGDEIPFGGSLPTLYSAYKGTLLKLLSQNQGAKVITLTLMHQYDRRHSTMAEYLADEEHRRLLSVMIQECSEYYSVPCVDLWNESGVNFFNQDVYYPTTYNENPHFNEVGAKRIAELIQTKL